MGEQVIYFRGVPNPPPGEWLSLELVKDASAILKLSDDEMAKTADALATFPGFLDHRSLADLLNECIQDKKLAMTLAKFLWFVIAPPFKTEFIKALRFWQKKHESDKDPVCPIDADGVEEINRRLNSLVGCVPAFDRRQKAERLQNATGLRLEKFELICDVRPIFDADRKEIEGWIPLTHLKLVCESEAGLPEAFEAVLSDADVRRIHQATEKAVQKLDALRKLASQTGIPIPSVSLTEREGKMSDSLMNQGGEDE